MAKAKEKADDRTPFERLTDFARKIVSVSKDEVETPKRKKRRASSAHGRPAR